MMAHQAQLGSDNEPQSDPQRVTRLQCPNCCRLAFVVRRDMGLLFFECELCGTVGAVPDSDDD
jgi:hypothetical protein